MHGCHIRKLAISADWLLWGSLLPYVNRLVSLTILPLKPSWQFAISQEFDIQQASNPVAAMVNNAFPGAFFGYHTSGTSVRNIHLTRACWYMIFTNKNLRQILFCHKACKHLVPFSLGLQDNAGVTLAMQSRIFLRSVLMFHPHLAHLEMGQYADDYLLTRLAYYFTSIISFTHTGTVLFDPNAFSQPPQQQSALLSLTFKQTINCKQLRWIVQSFPRLQQLFVLGSYNENQVDGFTLLPRLANSSIQTILVARWNLLCDAQICFHAVKKLSVIDHIVGVHDDPPRILRAFPALEQFNFMHNVTLSNPVNHHQPFYSNIGHAYRFRSLAVKPEASLRMVSLFDIINRSPVLTHVKLQVVSPAIVSALGDRCRNLEFVQFHLTQSCSSALAGILVNCPHLKVFKGRNHQVDAVDILRLPEWPCPKLQKLDIVIVNVFCRKSKQQQLLEKLERKLKLAKQNRLEEEVITQLEKEFELQLQMPKDTRLLKSRRYQRSVFAKLGQFTRLEEVDFRASEKLNESLDFNLDSGLDELASLNRLKKIAFEIKKRWFGMEEPGWLWNRWRMLENLEESGVFCVAERM
jgi:hypothetical protein